MKLFHGMDETQYWITLWTFCILCLFAISLMFAVDSEMHGRRLHDLIEQGHDPIELACLYKSTESVKIPCHTIAEAKAKILEAQAVILRKEAGLE